MKHKNTPNTDQHQISRKCINKRINTENKFFFILYSIPNIITHKFIL